MAWFLSLWSFIVLIVVTCIHNGNPYVFGFGVLYILGNEQVADLLLRSGANPNAVERDGSSPLHRAAVKGMIFQYLMRLKCGGQ